MAIQVDEMRPEHAQIYSILSDPMLDPDMVKDTIEGLSAQEMADIVDGFADHISDLKSAAASADKRAKEFQGKRDEFNYQAQAEKDALEKLFRLHGDRKIKTAYYSVGIQKNGGLQPLEIDGDINDIPPDYLIERDPVPNNDKIRELLKTQTVPWAHLKERGESLRIK